MMLAAIHSAERVLAAGTALAGSPASGQINLQSTDSSTANSETEERLKDASSTANTGSTWGRF